MFFQKGNRHLFYFVSFWAFTIVFSSCKNTKNITSAKDATNDKETETKNNISSKKKIQIKYSEQLGVQKENITNIELYSFIDEWMGVPYKYGGKTKEGVDCSDLTVILCKTVYNKTIEVPSSKIYSQCKPIDLKEIQEGDLVFFKIDGDKISHVGVYLQNNKFVHATTKKGVMINDLNEPYYKKYFYKAARIK